MNLIEFAKIAKKARNHIERWSPDCPPNFEGQCGLASFHLIRLANKKNIYPTFVGGLFIRQNTFGHCWVTYKNFIIDITATQFSNNFNPVHIVPVNNVHYVPDFETNSSLDAWDNIKDWVEYPFTLKWLSR